MVRISYCGCFIEPLNRAYSKNTQESAPEQNSWTGDMKLGLYAFKLTRVFDVWTGIGPETKKKERPREGRSL